MKQVIYYQYDQTILLLQRILKIGGFEPNGAGGWSITVTPENEGRIRDVCDIMAIYVEDGEIPSYTIGAKITFNFPDDTKQEAIDAHQG